MVNTRKIFCDICGKEIVKINEIWKYKLIANKNNERVSYNETLGEVCESCATIIHCCVSMMKECKWEPDFHEVLDQDDAWESETATYKLEEFKNINRDI